MTTKVRSGDDYIMRKHTRDGRDEQRVTVREVVNCMTRAMRPSKVQYVYNPVTMRYMEVR